MINFYDDRGDYDDHADDDSGDNNFNYGDYSDDVYDPYDNDHSSETQLSTQLHDHLRFICRSS